MAHEGLDDLTDGRCLRWGHEEAAEVDVAAAVLHFRHPGGSAVRGGPDEARQVSGALDQEGARPGHVEPDGLGLHGSRALPFNDRSAHHISACARIVALALVKVAPVATRALKITFQATLP